MEEISLEIPTCLDNSKQNEHIITLVDDSVVINDSDNLIHHVLDANNTCIEGATDHCLICNRKLSVSGRGVIPIFSNKLKTTVSGMKYIKLINSIVERDLNEKESHSSVICKKCFKVLGDVDSMEVQLRNFKADIKNKFQFTEKIVKEGRNEYPIFESLPEENKILKITAKSRVRKQRKLRGRPYNFVKLGMKETDFSYFSIKNVQELSNSLEEEEEEIDSDAAYSSILTNGTKSEEMKIEVKDVFEVDGLDLDNTDNIFQIGGMCLPTVSIEMAEKEIEDNPSFEENDSRENEKVKYKCRFCQFYSNFFYKMKDHLLMEHLDCLYDCEVCNERKSGKEELIQHLYNHVCSGWKPYECHLCPKRYFLPRQFKVHLRHHLTKTLSCYRCPRRFRSEAAFQEHLNSHTGYRPYTCEKCEKCFTTKQMLKTHVRTHSARARPFSCKVCSKAFLNIHHLTEHMLIHKEKEFVCETCGKSFSTHRSLCIHAITHSGIKNYPCAMCSKSFARKCELLDHERTHTGEKPFQCEICGATFCQRSNLASHKRATHTGERRYQCGECSKAFKRKRLLMYHIMSAHTGERPYKCKFCSAAFVYPEHFKKHQRVHSGEKPFSCEICGKKFNSRDNKNSHKFIHSDKKLYECLVCTMGFMRKPLIIAHIEHHHPCDTPEKFIKVNPPSVVEEELLGTKLLSGSPLTIKIDEVSVVDDQIQQVIHTSNQEECRQADNILSKSIQIFDSPDDNPRYSLQKSVGTSDNKLDESIPRLIATLQGQFVEVRSEDLERYTDLSTDHQLSQVVSANSNADVPMTSHSSDFRFFHIQIEEDKDQSETAAASLVPVTLSQVCSSSQNTNKFDTPIILGGKHTQIPQKKSDAS